MSNLPAVFSTSQTLRKILQDTPLRIGLHGQHCEFSSAGKLFPVPCSLFPTPYSLFFCTLSPCLPVAHFSNPAPPPPLPPHCRRMLPSCRKLAKDASTSPSAAGATKISPSTSSAQWASQLGLKGVDLLEVDEWEIPRHYGLICTMGYAGGGTIADAAEPRREPRRHRGRLSQEHSRSRRRPASPTSSPSPETARACPTKKARATPSLGLNRVKNIAEDNDVTICLELLNSKVNHHDYMADHTAWGAARHARGQLAARQAALRHLPHADHGRGPHRTPSAKTSASSATSTPAAFPAATSSTQPRKSSTPRS